MRQLILAAAALFALAAAPAHAGLLVTVPGFQSGDAILVLGPAVGPQQFAGIR